MRAVPLIVLSYSFELTGGVDFLNTAQQQGPDDARIFISSTPIATLTFGVPIFWLAGKILLRPKRRRTQRAFQMSFGERRVVEGMDPVIVPVPNLRDL
jgi:hypothetical protein